MNQQQFDALRRAEHPTEEAMAAVMLGVLADSIFTIARQPPPVVLLGQGEYTYEWPGKEAPEDE